MPKENNKMTQSERPLSGFIANWVLHLPLPQAKDSKSLASYYFVRARILYCLGQYDQAIGDFRNTLRLNWRHEQAAAWLNKANCAGWYTADKSLQSANPPSTRWMWPVV